MSVLLVMEGVSKTVTTLLVHMIVAVMLDSNWKMTIMLVPVSINLTQNSMHVNNNWGEPEQAPH